MRDRCLSRASSTLWTYPEDEAAAELPCSKRVSQAIRSYSSATSRRINICGTSVRLRALALAHRRIYRLLGRGCVIGARRFCGLMHVTYPQWQHERVRVNLVGLPRALPSVSSILLDDASLLLLEVPAF
jgi:hypothetical protein